MGRVSKSRRLQERLDQVRAQMADLRAQLERLAEQERRMLIAAEVLASLDDDDFAAVTGTTQSAPVTQAMPDVPEEVAAPSPPFDPPAAVVGLTGRIERFFEQSDEVHTTAEVKQAMAELGFTNPDSVGGILSRLVRQNKLETVGYGRYRRKGDAPDVGASEASDSQPLPVRGAQAEGTDQLEGASP